MVTHRLLATKEIWSDLIFDGLKRFDFRKGFRNILIGDTVIFVEAGERKSYW